MSQTKTPPAGKAASGHRSTTINTQDDVEELVPGIHPGHAFERARSGSSSLTSRDMQQLHGAVGNQAVQQLMRATAAPPGIQAKLKVNTPGDAYEQEADRVADQVMRMSESTPLAGGTAPAGGRVDPITTSLSAGTVARQAAGDRVPVVTGEIVPGSFEILEDEEEEKQPAATAPTTPPGQWGADYKTKKSRIKETYETYKGTIGKVKERPELKAASAWGGIKVSTTITTDQLTRIISAAGEAATTARIAPMAGQISAAFAAMNIDTAQAQGAYLGHMAGETGGVLEEVDGDKRWYAPFQGRGPVQVTHEYNYVQSLAYIETRAEQLEKEAADKENRITELEAKKAAAPAGEDTSATTAEIDKLKVEVATAKKQAKELRDAHSAVKGDPKLAADPRYAFVFSAAFMHMTGGVRSAGKLGQTASFTGKGSEDSWVTGGNVQQGVVQPDKSKKDVSMTFQERLDYAQKNNMPVLENDMKSAIDRGGRKSKVYGKAVSILGTENKI